MRLNRVLRLPARLKARGSHTVPPGPANSSPRADGIIRKRRRRDGGFDSRESQGVFDLTVSSLIAGIFGAFAEGLALYAAAMAPELHHPDQDSEPARRSRSQIDGSVREDTTSILQESTCRPVSIIRPRPKAP
jgi:hypothetical protein